MFCVKLIGTIAAHNMTVATVLNIYANIKTKIKADNPNILEFGLVNK